jgi:hypothetical protein
MREVHDEVSSLTAGQERIEKMLRGAASELTAFSLLKWTAVAVF